MPRKKKQNPVELRIESIAFEGVGIARRNDKVHFVKYAVPGDLVKAVVTRKKKSFNQAQLLEILEESPDRIEPRCKYFGTCGGCSWQNLPYEVQLKWKSIHVKDAFERIGKIIPSEYLPALRSDREFNYRNKMEFSFSANRWLTQSEINSGEKIDDKHFALGLHVPGRYDKVLDIEECHIHDERCNPYLAEIRKKAYELEISAWNTNNNSGFLRELGLRYTKLENGFMVILVTNKVVEENEKKFIEWFGDEFSRNNEIITAIHAINSTNSPVKIESREVLKGEGFIFENILGVKFRISPFSFFQTNSYQLDKFIGKILEFAGLKSHKTIWDLYCGTGSISLPAAKVCGKVIGVELVESSISDAKQNAELNNISNTEFHAADLHAKEIPDLLERLDKPDKIIIDPPRMGMHKNLVEHLLKIEAPEIIYVSCNPSTQARDCGLLSEKYSVEKVMPVDMFPQTYHVEAIAKLVLKNN